jgi:peptidoglycan/LPS O-acetylase OafA/YrhL
MQLCESVKGKITALEGVRGSAALVVLLCHLLTSIDGVPNFPLLNIIGNMGTDAVVVFFLLSGFVISISTRPETPAKIYLSKRLVRILPIFIFSLLIAYGVEIVVNGPVLIVGDVIGNFLFLGSLQAFIVPLVSTNGPLWSLGCEMFFYILFFVVLIKKRFLFLWFIFAIFSISFYPLFITKHGVLAYLIFNFSFSVIWLLGFFAAKYKDKVNFNEMTVVFSCAIALAFSRIDFIAAYYDIYRFLFFSIFLVPAFVYLTSKVKSTINISKWALVMSWIVAIFLLWQSNSGQSTKLIITMALPVYLTLKAIGILDLSNIKRSLEKISWTGNYSYALYATHFPLIVLVNRIDTVWYVKIPVAILTCSVVSYFLEGVFQRYFNRKFLIRKY